MKFQKNMVDKEIDSYLDCIFACKTTLVLLISHNQERPAIFVKGQASHCVVGHDCVKMAKIFDDLNSVQVHALFAENCSRSLFTNLLETSVKTGEPLKNNFHIFWKVRNMVLQYIFFSP